MFDFFTKTASVNLKIIKEVHITKCYSMSTTTETQTNSMNIQTHAEEDTRIIQLSEEV